MGTIVFSTTFRTQNCINCGVPFAMPSNVDDQFRRNGNSFYCPNGHSQFYTDTEIKKMRRLEEQAERARLRESAVRDQLAAAERSARAYKGVATRTKNRAKKGVCPVVGCKRHFVNVERHIISKHPNYITEESCS